MPRWLLIVLIVLNVTVLLGQIWPAFAPPFARAISITFLAMSLAAFAWLLGRAKRR